MFGFCVCWFNDCRCWLGVNIVWVCLVCCVCVFDWCLQLRFSFDLTVLCSLDVLCFAFC